MKIDDNSDVYLDIDFRSKVREQIFRVHANLRPIPYIEDSPSSITNILAWYTIPLKERIREKYENN